MNSWNNGQATEWVLSLDNAIANTLTAFLKHLKTDDGVDLDRPNGYRANFAGQAPRDLRYDTKNGYIGMHVGGGKVWSMSISECKATPENAKARRRTSG